MVNVLAKKAVLAQLSISRWGARTFDDSTTAEILEKNKANKNAGLFTKRLLDKEAMANIRSIAHKARALHHHRTMPWLDDGVRILPTVLYMSYTEEMRKLRDEFLQEVRKFSSDYPRFIDEARKSLGALFSKDDYPAPGSIAARFRFEIIVLPCPDAQDFRVSLDKQQLAEIRGDLDQRMNQQLKDALSDTGARLIEVVGHMAERLKAYKPGDKAKGKKAEGKFHDSLIEHVREIAGLLPAFNLMDDPKLAKIAGRVSAELCGHDGDALREDDKLRKQVAKSADAILKDVKDFLA